MNLVQTNHTKQHDSRQIQQAYASLVELYLASNHRKRVERIEKAFKFALEAHAGVYRLSGEPYIMHPIEVAKIVVSELGLGSTSICAALLHDVVEHTEFTLEDIESNFGPKIASIVGGISKISGGIFGDKAFVEGENFRKLLLSMSTDIRVVLIKMSDRLHNMRTARALPAKKRQKISLETLYVYAPLADRLGLNKIKIELEDLAFRQVYPDEYLSIVEKVQNSEQSRRLLVEEFVAPVCSRLDQAGIKYEIKARVKSAWSIFNKMRRKKIPFEKVFDVYAVRVIFDCPDRGREPAMCRKIYGYFTDLYRPHPDRLRDWTSVPKANGYSALHVTVLGPSGRWTEVQIRSRRMDEVAELGCAAHWKYKTGEQDDSLELDSWMNTIKEILAQPTPDTIDFLDSIKLNLYSSEIYVFTPKGDLITLPSGATVLDMAFDIHSQLGAHCVAGKINHKLVPLSHPLESGDQVEIITSSSQRPAADWLKFCHSAKARNALHSILRRECRDADFSLGINNADCIAKAEEDNVLAGPACRVDDPGVQATIAIEGTDRRGILHSITHLISDELDIDIRHLSFNLKDGRFNCTVGLAHLPQGSPASACRGLLAIDGIDNVGPAI
ncbi:MAG: RelA/SpoT family protein [Muribaculum sp.]|nr:RelA/SpoT family protein [Muribaculum sp.]